MPSCSIETRATLPLAKLAAFVARCFTAQKSVSLHDPMLNLSAFLKAFQTAWSFPATKSKARNLHQICARMPGQNRISMSLHPTVPASVRHII
jgi:hypothetical protein